jgi:hypothetical protein
MGICEICNAPIPAYKTLEDHERMGFHKRNVENLAIRDKGKKDIVHEHAPSN